MNGLSRQHARLIEALERLPLDELRAALGSTPAYLVGGSVRDAMLGEAIGADLDLAVDGEVEPVLGALGGDVRRHRRFQTARVELGGATIDIARTRSESYPQPGALPIVSPAPIDEDLARRDFTVNAIAVPLRGEPTLIDPYDGGGDLERRRLRVLHRGSFVDDPTRALRAGRYAARLGFAVEPETARLLAAADLGTVSTQRIDAETLRICEEAEPVALRALELLDEWGLIGIGADRLGLAAAVAGIARERPWRDLVDPGVALHAAALGHLPGGRRDVVAAGRELALASVERPSQALVAARGHDELELLLAAALGAEWAVEWVGDWRDVALEIDGTDLIEAGVARGPAIGRGLEAALRAKLDGELAGREQELACALAAAARDTN